MKLSSTGISVLFEKDWKYHCHKCSVKLDSRGNARGVILNLALVISTPIWKFEGKSMS